MLLALLTLSLLTLLSLSLLTLLSLSLLTLLSLLPLLILTLLSLLSLVALLTLLPLLIALWLATLPESTRKRLDTPSEVPRPVERFPTAVFLDVTDRFTRSPELLREFLDDPSGFSLEFLGVLTVLDADEPPGIADTFLEFIVLDRPSGLVQPVCRLPLVGPGVTVKSVDFSLEVGDFFVQRLFALEKASPRWRTRSVVHFSEPVHVRLDVSLFFHEFLGSLSGLLHIAAETVHLVSFEAPLCVLQSIEGGSRVGGRRVPGTRSGTAHIRSRVFKTPGRVSHLLIVVFAGEAFEAAGRRLGLFGQFTLAPVTGTA